MTTRPPEPQVEVRKVFITPEMALKFLEGTTVANRSISERRVDSYVAEIKRGDWTFNHQGIALDKDGNLIDGQHRMWAIVRADQGVWMMVSKGDINRDNIDSGGVRSVADQMFLLDGTHHSKMLVSRACICHEIEMGSIDTSSKLTLALARESYAHYQEGLEWSVRDLGSKRTFGTAPFAGTLAYGHATNPEKVAEFTRQVRDGEGLVKSDPAYPLREKLLSMSGGTLHYTRYEVVAMTMRALLAYLKGERLMVIKPNVLDSKFFKDARTFFRKAHKNVPAQPTKDAVPPLVRKKPAP